jgi:diguanylate cyclase (GGDEF)-like protein
MKFVNNLIAEKIPFTFSIIDLDNFKYVNDNFGHSAGDHVLKYVSKEIANTANDYGLVGRFGGDELLMVDLKNVESNQKKSFFENLYTKSGALRIMMDFDTGSSMITATVGCASYPSDADNFDELFNIIDKMLYIGKGKGRDCYTIYDESVHKDIEVSSVTRKGMFREMQNIKALTSRENDLRGKLKAAMSELKDIMQIEDLYYVEADGRMRSVNDTKFDGDASDISNFMKEDIFAERTLECVEKESPIFYETLRKRGLSSALIMRFSNGMNEQCYLVCAVERKYRIWQDNECAILYYLAGLLG